MWSKWRWGCPGCRTSIDHGLNVVAAQEYIKWRMPWGWGGDIVSCQRGIKFAKYVGTYFHCVIRDPWLQVQCASVSSCLSLYWRKSGHQYSWRWGASPSACTHLSEIYDSSDPFASLTNTRAIRNTVFRSPCCCVAQGFSSGSQFYQWCTFLNSATFVLLSNAACSKMFLKAGHSL